MQLGGYLITLFHGLYALSTSIAKLTIHKQNIVVLAGNQNQSAWIPVYTP